MSDGLLSLQWNNHKSTLHHMLLNVRRKERYADTTLACDGKLYPVHKLVLSMCSDYFEQIFAQIECTKHPVIVLKDIKQDELECLLNYMYVGEVNVVQERLSGLIKAAECLRIKGLAVPDEEPSKEGSKTKSLVGNSTRDKRTSEETHSSSDTKRRKQDTNFNDSSSRQSNYTSQFRNDDSRRFSERSSSNTRHRNGTNSNNVSSSGTSTNSKVTNNNNTSCANSKRRSLPERTEQTSQISKQSSEERQRRESASSLASLSGHLSPVTSRGTQESPLPEVVSAGEDEGVDEDDIKTEETVEEPLTSHTQQKDLVIDEPPLEVKAEPNTENDEVYLEDANSDEAKGTIFDSLAGDGSAAAGGSDNSNQMHFMEELLNQTAASDQGNMSVGDYGDTGEGTSSAAGQHIMALYGSPLHGQVSPNSTSSLMVRSNTSEQSPTCLPLQLPWQYTAPQHSLQLHQEASRSPTSNMIIPPMHLFLSSQGEIDTDNSSKKSSSGKCYSCSYCRYITCRKSDYSKHLRVHTGERPYQCLQCHYSASDASNLRAHVKKVHPLRVQQQLPNQEGNNQEQDGGIHNIL